MISNVLCNLKKFRICVALLKHKWDIALKLGIRNVFWRWFTQLVDLVSLSHAVPLKSFIEMLSWYFSSLVGLDSPPWWAIKKSSLQLLVISRVVPRLKLDRTELLKIKTFPTYSHWGSDCGYSASSLAKLFQPNFKWRAILSEHFCYTGDFSFPLKSCATILTFNSNKTFVIFF